MVSWAGDMAEGVNGGCRAQRLTLTEADDRLGLKGALFKV